MLRSNLDLSDSVLDMLQEDCLKFDGFTFTYLADAFIQSDLQCIQAINCISMCSLGIEPTTFALLTQCSTTEPQEQKIDFPDARIGFPAKNTNNNCNYGNVRPRPRREHCFNCTKRIHYKRWWQPRAIPPLAAFRIKGPLRCIIVLIKYSS